MIALFSKFFVFNIHYTYTFLNHNMLRVLLLILKISINMHLTALKNTYRWVLVAWNAIKNHTYRPDPNCRGVEYMSANLYFKHRKIFWRPSPVYHVYHISVLA